MNKKDTICYSRYLFFLCQGVFQFSHNVLHWEVLDHASCASDPSMRCNVDISCWAVLGSLVEMGTCSACRLQKTPNALFVFSLSLSLRRVTSR